MEERTFAIIGAAGYIARKHLQAIKDVGGKLVAAVDKHDSLGILDSYYPDADVFTEIERFERHIERNPVDYVVICTPNYLHDSHIRLALRSGCNVICEKPVTLNPWNIQELMIEEQKSGKKVNVVLQLRLHEAIKELKDFATEDHKIKLEYHTPRGKWYKQSWKADKEKSGGIATNIGVHLFDMLIWVFGEVQNYDIKRSYGDTIDGVLKLKNAYVEWELSIDQYNQPLRKLEIDGAPIDFTKGFTDLHTKVYEEILKGNGFTLEDALPSINLVSKLR